MLLIRRPAWWQERVLVLLGVALISLNLRIAVASVSPVLGLVRADVPFSASQAGILGTIPVVSFAVFGSLAPLVARRFGLEATLVVATLVSAVGEIARSTSTGSTSFLIWSVVALAGMGMGNVLLPPLVKRWFPGRIGAVTSLYTVMMAFSTALPPLLAVPLARELGWRVSIGSWAVVGIVAAIPWAIVAVRRRDVHAAARVTAAGSPPRGRGRVWRSPLAWGMALAFGMNSLNSYVLFAWLPQILIEAGVDVASAGRWLALMAILGLPAAWIAPLVATRVRNPFGLVVAFVTIFVVGYLGLLLDPVGATGLWMVLVGFGPSTFPLLLTLITLRTRTAAGAVALSGFAQGTGYTLAACGPILVGVLFEASGSFDSSIFFLFGSLALLLLGAWFACRPGMLEDSWGDQSEASEALVGSVRLTGDPR